MQLCFSLSASSSSLVGCLNVSSLRARTDDDWCAIVITFRSCRSRGIVTEYASYYSHLGSWSSDPLAWVLALLVTLLCCTDSRRVLAPSLKWWRWRCVYGSPLNGINSESSRCHHHQPVKERERTAFLSWPLWHFSSQGGLVEIFKCWPPTECVHQAVDRLADRTIRSLSEPTRLSFTTLLALYRHGRSPFILWNGTLSAHSVSTKWHCNRVIVEQFLVSVLDSNW